MRLSMECSTESPRPALPCPRSYVLRCGGVAWRWRSGVDAVLTTEIAALGHLQNQLAQVPVQKLGRYLLYGWQSSSTGLRWSGIPFPPNAPAHPAALRRRRRPETLQKQIAVRLNLTELAFGHVVKIPAIWSPKELNKRPFHHMQNSILK